MFREFFFLHHFIPYGVGAGAAKIEEPGAGAAKNGRLRNTVGLSNVLRAFISFFESENVFSVATLGAKSEFCKKNEDFCSELDVGGTKMNN
jgi:hypothetical protein